MDVRDTTFIIGFDIRDLPVVVDVVVAAAAVFACLTRVDCCCCLSAHLVTLIDDPNWLLAPIPDDLAGLRPALLRTTLSPL